MKKSLKHIVLLVVASALVALFSSSCNTIHGVGKDVGAVGNTIEHVSR